MSQILNLSGFDGDGARPAFETAAARAFSMFSRLAPHRGVALLLTALALWLGWLAQPALAAPAPPANFAVEDVLTGIEQPMALRFLPDGRMLVALKKGEIRIVNVQSLPIQSQVYMNFVGSASGIDSDQERGVLDLAVDPNFPTSPYVYVFYTPVNGPNGARSRVARFTHLENSGGVTSRGDLSTELILWEETEGYDSCCHFGGGLDFGPDGHLWLTTGDHFQGSYATDLQKAGGKVHRFTKTGGIPAGNPYNDGAGPNVDTIFAYGLRNPFRSRWDLPSGRFYIGEVGGNTQSIAWEDLHMIRYDDATGRFVDADFGTGGDNGVYDGINFGWPTVEGLPPYTDFPGAILSSNVGQPFFAYRHSNNFAAINGGIVYRATQFPNAYSNAYFYADSTRDFIRYLKLGTNGAIIPNPSPAPVDYKNPDLVSRPFDLTPTGRIVSLEVGPDGALYYVSFTDSGGAYGEPDPLILGAVRRYVYDDGNARPNITEFSVTPASGPPPLNSVFALRATDPETNAMTYVIDFGDGTPILPPAPLAGNVTTNIPHTYTNAGARVPTVYVSDGAKTATHAIGVLVGTPPVVTTLGSTNARPGALTNMFRYGDTVHFSATATDPEDGALTGASFSWSISFIRPGNTHPAFGPVTGTNAIDFPIPNQGQGFSGPVYYRCFLTVTDSSGLSTLATIDIFPEKADIAFDTVPSGLLVQVDGNTAKPTPFVLDSLINVNHLITVYRSNCLSDTQYVFTNWSNGALTNQIIYNVPATNSALTAHYAAAGPCPDPGATLITAGLVLQLESDLNVALLASNTVAGWLDQSGLGNDTVAGGSPKLGNVLTPSGLPAISLNGTTDKLERSAPLGGLPGANLDRTMFVLAKYNSAGAWGGVAYGNGAFNQAFGLAVRNPTGELILQGWGGGNDLISAEPGIGAGWLVQSARLTNGNAALYRDGSQVAQFAHTYNTVLSKIAIGQEIAGLGYVGMDVAAILVYNRALSDTERTNVETYLYNKYLNTPPTVSIIAPANLSAHPSGAPVTFTGSASDSRDNPALLTAGLAWNSSLDGPIGMGGSFNTSALSTGTHVITASVVDSGGASNSASITITVGTVTPPVITSFSSTNDRPGAATNTFRFGDTLRLAGAATDAEDGALGGSNFTWTVSFIRPGATNLVLGPVTGTNAINFPIPNQSQGFSGPVFYRARLVVADSGGLTTNAFIDLLPEKVNLTLNTSPGGLPVQVDGGAPQSTPLVLDTLINLNHLVSVATPVCVGTNQFAFASWSNGALTNQVVYNVPPSNSALTASYTLAGLCAPPPSLLTTGLVLRLESDTNVTLLTNATVAAWLDQSARSNHTLAGGAPQWGAVSTPSGLPAISLDGTNDLLQRAATLNGFPSGNSNRTLFVVAQYNSASAWAGVAYGNGAANEAFGLGVVAPTGELVLQGWGGGNDLVSSVPTIGAGWMLQAGLVSNSIATLFTNGAPVAQFTHAYNTVLNRLVIGEEIAGLGYAGLDVAAVLLYDRALTPAERASVEDYLRDKYFNTPPVITITAPANLTTNAAGASVAFAATSTDAEDDTNTLAAAIQWTSSLDGLIGVGATFSTTALTPGAHVITATVTDSGGLSDATNISLTITAAPGDTTPPVITVPSNIVAQATGPGGETVNFTTSAFDAVDGVVPTTNNPASGSLFPLGVTVVNVSAGDAVGNVAFTNFTVTVVDTLPPVFSGATNHVREATGPGGVVVTFTVLANDLVSGAVTVTNTPPSGGVFPLGVTVVNSTASDAAGNLGATNFTVTVVDTTAPVFSGLSNVTQEATGPTGAVVTFSVLANDLVDGAVTVTNTPPSGSVFPLGVTLVNVSAGDTNGNVATTNFTVTVLDSTAPMLSGATNLTREATGPTGALVTLDVTATDLVDGSVPVTFTPPWLANFTRLGDFSGGLRESVGVAVNSSGITVVGWGNTTNGPEATSWTSAGGLVGLGFLPGGDPFSLGYGINSNGTVIVGEARFGGLGQAFRWTNGGMTGLGFLPGHDHSAANAVNGDGSVIVGYSRPVAGNELAFRWTSSAGMTNLGHLGGDGYSQAYAVSHAGDAVAGYTSTPLGQEAFRWTEGGGMVALGVLSNALIHESAAQGISGDGSVVVGYSYSASGQEAFRWTAGGGLTGLGDLPGGLTNSIAYAVNVDGSVVVGAGDTDDGTEAFIWDTTHGMRNLRQVLTNHGATGLDGWLLLDAFGISADGTVVTGTAINPDGQLESYVAVVASNSPLSGGLFPLGTTLVNASAADTAGNVTNASFTVTVVDTTPPVISGATNLTREATGPAGAVVNFTVTASDLVSPAGTVVVSNSPPSGSVFPLGPTLVTVIATDAVGNTATNTFTVTVADTAAPVFGAVTNLVAEATGPGGAVVNFTVTATDLVDGAVTVTNTPPSGSVFPLGGTVVNSSAGDTNGNLAVTNFTVTVVDTTPPALTLVGTNPFVVLFGETFTDPGATAFDLVGGNLTGSIVVSGDTVDTNTLGAYMITYTVADAAGNTNQTQRTVLVVELVAPPLLVERLQNLTDDARISFDTVLGLVYELQTSTDLVNWPTLETLNGDGTLAQRIHTGGGADPWRYYRVVVTRFGD
jgi:probable HAF family extracellular repeat protein